VKTRCQCRPAPLAALAGDVARGDLPARLAYANALHGLIGELATGRGRKLDGDATVLAILAVGAVSSPGLGDSKAQRLAAALRAAGGASASEEAKPRQSRNDPAHAGKPLALVGPGALHETRAGRA
jgi:hypothetical protein